MLAYVQLMMIAIDTIRANGLYYLSSFAYMDVIQISEKTGLNRLFVLYLNITSVLWKRGLFSQTGFECLLSGCENTGYFFSSLRSSPHFAGDNAVLSKDHPKETMCVWKEVIIIANS